MSDVLESLKTQLETLSSRDRIELAKFLIDSLDTEDDAECEQEWDAELARRAAEIRAGTAVGKPADQVFDELRARLA
jgi:putative addiction module component (TIGR02574 family)